MAINLSDECHGHPSLLGATQHSVCQPKCFLSSHKRDLPGCPMLVLSVSFYVEMFPHIKLSHTFVISIWLLRTGAGGVKFVVSISPLLCTYSTESAVCKGKSQSGSRRLIPYCSVSIIIIIIIVITTTRSENKRTMRKRLLQNLDVWRNSFPSVYMCSCTLPQQG